VGVSFCCVWDKLGRFRVSNCALCVEEFGAGLWQFVCAVFWTFRGGILVVSEWCLWDSLERSSRRVFLLSVGKFGTGMGVSVVFCLTVLGNFGGVSVCCVFDSLGLVLGSECVLCVGLFGAGCGGFLGVILCCV